MNTHRLHISKNYSLHFHSKSWTFVPIESHDFLLVINCDSGSIFHHFRDIAPRSELKTIYLTYS